MKIVELNNIHNWYEKVTCRGCHTKLNINDEDLSYEDVGDEYVEDPWYFVCPECKYQTSLRWDEDPPPDIILDNAKARYYSKPLKEKLTRKRNFPMIISFVIVVLTAIISLLFLRF